MGNQNMNRNLMLTLITIAALGPALIVRADAVTDWNTTIHDVMQDVPAKANPGTSTRAIAMMNGAIYDVYQSFNRTHQPLIAHHMKPAANANLHAAVAQAAHDILVDCYGEVTPELNTILSTRLGAISATQAEKDAGSAFGAAIAHKYIHKREADHSLDIVQYTGPGGIGHWQPDPRITPAQEAWGPGWGSVHTWVVPSSDYFDVDTPGSGRYETPGPPALNSPAYTSAFNMLKDYGSLNAPLRTADQTEVGIFWAYDRPEFGPPPVLFVKNLIDIANQTANTPEQNARLFAQASVAMSDAAVASWDIKFKDDFWRPISGLRQGGAGGAGDTDGNPDTVGDPNWEPLGAPADPNNPLAIDFTPPFPSYTSGHSTMGGALFESLKLFFGTNDFLSIPGANGLGEGGKFRLYSDEPGGGDFRDYDSFAHTSGLLEAMLDDANPAYTPDSENALSRVFLGVHWIFDQQDGMDLGHAIAQYVAANRFAAVPEPTSGVLLLSLAAVLGATVRRPRAA